MNSFRFRITARDGKSQAKVGEITTSHGVIRTPAYVPVATAASIKSLTPEELRLCNIDIFIVNTYHMLFRPGIDIVKKLGGIHQFMNWKGPIMTDSAGFQAFSLGDFSPRQNAIPPDKLVRIKNEGIYFKSAWDGSKQFLNPEKSIKAQQDLDSDIMMSFDECTFYPVTKKRAREAIERTQRWAKQGLNQHNKKKGQALYGIVQGSVFEDLRKESAKYIASLPFEGFAIGSVANSREPRELVFSVLDWTLPILLPYNKPIHFLGIGEVEDMLISIGKGIDSFDCVIPTRLARMGWIFTKETGLKNKFRYDVTKNSFALDKSAPDKNCGCFTCRSYTRGYLNHLFRSRELLAYRLATIHNLSFFGNLMEKIRTSIAEGKYHELMTEWLIHNV